MVHLNLLIVVKIIIENFDILRKKKFYFLWRMLSFEFSLSKSGLIPKIPIEWRGGWQGEKKERKLVVK